VLGETLLALLWLALLAALCGMDPAARLFTQGANQVWGLLGAALAALDHPDWRLSAMAWPGPLALLYWLGLASSQRLGRWRYFCGLCAAALLFTLLRPPAVAAPRRPALEILDVGQGDGILLEADGRSFLIDAGKPPLGATVVAALRARKTLRLQGCAATHQDSDHRGGLVAVMNALHCDALYLPAGSEQDLGMAPLLEIAAARRTPVWMLAKGDTLPFAAGRLRVLWPPSGRGDKPNDRGLVLLWENGDFHALLTADIEAATERELAPALPGGALLKVAHHGSKTSSLPEFLAAARPRIGFISVGANNGYGHPHPDALARLAEAGIPLIRTDQSGGIRISRVGDYFKLESADGAVRYRAVRDVMQAP
jgi:competence protein ComEC